MKIDISHLQADQTSGIEIYVDQSSDYQILFKLIKAGDIIETKIRRKDKSLKNPIFYAVVKILIENVELIQDPSETIHITGKVSSSDNENVKEGSKQSLWITDGCELQLIKSKWDKTDMETIDNIINPKSSEKVNLSSPRDLQEKCFDVLHKYLAKNHSLVTYGKETLEALEQGAVNVLFVTDDYIQRQNDHWKKSLSAEDHKYHGANIVVYDKGAKNYEELSNFGGIIGVLKYQFVAPNMN